MNTDLRFGYAILRPPRVPTEEDRARVLMIVDSAADAEEMAWELRGRGVPVEIRTAVGSGPATRLPSRTDN